MKLTGRHKLMNSVQKNTNNRVDTVDYNFCVFVTPRQVANLGIGLNLKDFQGCEDDVQPFIVDSLVDLARQHLLGSQEGQSFHFPVEKANCCVTLCLDINGKLCRLHRDELDWPNPFKGLPLSHQVKTFQRLLDEKRIDLNDLAVVDVDLEVYKQLCINDAEGEIQIAKWIVEQKSSKQWGQYFKPYENSPKLDWWEEMSFDGEDKVQQE